MNIDANVNNEIFRKDHPMILATNRHLATLLPVRLAYNASGYKAGTVLGKNSVSGYFEAYDNGASSGLDTAKCILFQAVPVESFADSSDTAVERGIFGGEVFYDKLVGVDSNAVTDLGGRVISDSSGLGDILKF